MFRSVFSLVCFSVLVLSGTDVQAATTNAKGQYKTLEGETLNDPTRPAGWNIKAPSAKQRVHYTLSYILNARDRKQAIVNGKKVTVGDWVEGAKVMSIRDGEVELLVSGTKRILRVNGKRASIKQ